MKKSLYLTCLLSLASGAASAQEAQVPFDSAKTIQVIDQGLEKKLNLFPHFPYFLEARLFLEPDSSYILEILSSDSGQQTQDRFPKTRSDVAAIRTDVDERMGIRTPAETLDQSSRTKFIVWETILSALGYASAMQLAIAPNNPGAGLGLELGFGLGGYFLSSALTENSPMTDGEGSLALGGAFLGAVHGILLDELIANGNTGREIGPVAMAASIAETGIGYSLASNNKMTQGSADIILDNGWLGMADGVGLAFAVDHSASTSLWAGLGLAGSAVGLAVGAVIAGNNSYTGGNATAVLTAGIFAPVIPIAIYASANAYNTSKPLTTGILLSGIAGDIGGVALANSLMQGRYLSSGEGTLVGLGTFGGLVIGEVAGLFLVANSRSSISPWALTLPIAIGTAAGYALTLALIGKGTGDKPPTGWNFDANPGALMGALLPQHSNAAPVISPIFSAKYSF